MKIIHCADIHLDSKMSANLTKEKARERKTELLTTFQNMVTYGAEQGVAAIIIAGGSVRYEKRIRYRPECGKRLNSGTSQNSFLLLTGES